MINGDLPLAKLRITVPRIAPTLVISRIEAWCSMREDIRNRRVDVLSVTNGDMVNVIATQVNQQPANAPSAQATA